MPPEFDNHRKMGFGIPIGQWFKNGPWRRLAEDILFDSESIFSQPEVANIFSAIDHNRSIKEHLFGLVLFELWRKEYGVSL